MNRLKFWYYSLLIKFWRLARRFSEWGVRMLEKAKYASLSCGINAVYSRVSVCDHGKLTSYKTDDGQLRIRCLKCDEEFLD